MEQQTNSKAAANAREIIFEHQKDNVIEFNDIYRYITEHGKNTNTIESLDFINASSITLVSKDAPDVYTCNGSQSKSLGLAISAIFGSD